MSSFRRTLCIGDIGFAVESEHDFLLSERCKAFEQELERPDVTIRLTQRAMELPAHTLVHAGENFDVVRTADGLLTLRYANSRKDDLLWYMRSTAPDRYEVIYSPTLPWAFESVNPLFFFDLAEFLIAYDAVILHSAVILLDGSAIAFTAPSGTGKSTQADLWHQYRQAEILNGDRGLIRRQDGYRVYGSPYAGSSHIYVAKSAPLRAIVVLRQAPFNRVRRIKGKEAYLHLLSQTSLSVWNKTVIEQQSAWLLDLIGSVPVYLLECLPNQGAVDTLYQELKGLGNG